MRLYVYTYFAFCQALKKAFFFLALVLNREDFNFCVRGTSLPEIQEETVYKVAILWDTMNVIKPLWHLALYEYFLEETVCNVAILWDTMRVIKPMWKFGRC